MPSEPLFRGRRPTALRFGTSGLRGLVTEITDLEAYVNTRGFLDYLVGIGEVRTGETVCIAGDLRPSTDSPGRSVMRSVARAVSDAGLRVANLGKIPTPALTYFAVGREQASVMVTGSHIPFDRNGIKFNRKSGEVLKEDEAGILRCVEQVRSVEYGRPDVESIFANDGMFKPGEERDLPPLDEGAALAYKRRYVEFFGAGGLSGMRVAFFQHSAVGRDLIVELLRELGAEIHPTGRSEEFVALDTEDISDDRLAALQEMVDEVARDHGAIDAIVSTDGDSDRPLLCGVEPGGKVRFLGGDLLGLMVAEYLEADSVSVPISANDAVDIQLAKRGVVAGKTRIGSPYVIEAMQRAQAEGTFQRVVGWEANGGFLTGSDIERVGRVMTALPTRDAVLPILAALFLSVESGRSLTELFADLPPRFSKAGLIDEFPQEASRAIVRRFSPGAADRRTDDIRRELSSFFTAGEGFGEIGRINAVDGVRIYFENGDIAHIRPSGNAPQLRTYAVADTQTRADEIVRAAICEPDGILRGMQAVVEGRG